MSATLSEKLQEFCPDVKYLHGVFDKWWELSSMSHILIILSTLEVDIIIVIIDTYRNIPFILKTLKQAIVDEEKIR